MTETCKWTALPKGHYYRKECGGLVILFMGKFTGLKCVCGRVVE